MCRKTIFFFIALCSLNPIGVSMGQSAKISGERSRTIDSLRSFLNSLDGTTSPEFAPTIKGGSNGLWLDTFRINTLNALAWELKNKTPDTAIVFSMQALQLAEKNKFQTGIGKSYHNLGVLNRIKGNFSLALDYSFKALALWEQLLSTGKNSKYVILNRKSATLSNIGIIYRNQGNLPKALNYYFTALKIAEELGGKNLIATNICNIAAVYWNQGNYPKALDYFFKALKIDEELGDKSGVSRLLGNIGLVYSNQGDYPKALDYDFKGLKIAEELGDKSGIAYTLGNIATVYKEQASKAKSREDLVASDSLCKKALNYYFTALKMAEELGDKNLIASWFGHIGLLDTQMKKYKEAEKYLQKGLTLSTIIKALNIVGQIEEALSNLYTQTGQPVKALEHYKKYILTRDSIFNEENTKKTVRTEMNFEFEKKRAIEKAEQEKQNAIEKEEKQKQKIILILVLVFAGFMFNRWRITRRQKLIIAKQKENIVDSITYAQRIQQSILMEESEIQKYLPDSFIYYQPKDIVSGDFYWFSEVVGSSELVVGSKKEVGGSSELVVSSKKENDSHFLNSEQLTTNYEQLTKNYKLIIAAIDCTGHGVPGAFMSMIGNTLLNQIVNEKQVTVPSEILRLMNLGVYEALHQKKEGALSLDGMDMALCCIDFKNNQLQYAGAQNPIFVLSDKEIKVFNADKQTIGGGGWASKKTDQSKIEYTNHCIPIKKGMSIYLFTDGYMDQFGGSERKKFRIQKFKELLLNSQHLSMQKQKEVIATSHEKWKGNVSQTDDILVMGIRF